MPLSINNISVIMVISFIGGAGVGETRVPGENHRSVPNYWHTYVL